MLRHNHVIMRINTTKSRCQHRLRAEQGLVLLVDTKGRRADRGMAPSTQSRHGSATALSKRHRGEQGDTSSTRESSRSLHGAANNGLILPASHCF